MLATEFLNNILQMEGDHSKFLRTAERATVLPKATGVLRACQVKTNSVLPMIVSPQQEVCDKFIKIMADIVRSNSQNTDRALRVWATILENDESFQKEFKPN